MKRKQKPRKISGVRNIIDDADIYNYLKLWAAFVRIAGYSGLLVCIDEMGVLSHRVSHAGARSANFEAILQIVNDCFQGGAEGVGFFFAGIDEFLDDQRRGLFSNGASGGDWKTRQCFRER